MNARVFGSFLNNKDKKVIPVCFSPASKSHSIRFLILASLARGKSIIHNILDSEDISSCYQCLKALGVSCVKSRNKQNSVDIRPPKEGIKSYVKKQKEIILNVGNSGTLLYVLSMLVSGLPANFYIMGDSSIKKRPLEPVIEVLKELGISFDVPNTSDGIINIQGKEIKEEILLKLEGKFSQVVTGLLISMPFFHKTTSIKLNKAGEAPYLKMTLKHLKQQNIDISFSKDLKSYSCKGEQVIEGFEAIVPSDWSSASFLALASIASFSPISIGNLSLDDEQADSKLLYYLRKLKVPVIFKNKILTINYTKPCMKGNNFNIAKTPDILPALACIASLADGKTILKGIDICRYKECNRVKAIAFELNKLGANIEEKKDSLIIEGVDALNSDIRLCSYKDHRIALALIALCLHLSKNEACIVEDISCCAVSYPNFIETLKGLGANIECLN